MTKQIRHLHCRVVPTKLRQLICTTCHATPCRVEWSSLRGQLQSFVPDDPFHSGWETNEAQVLYRQSTPHRSVPLCAVGAVAFYLQGQFKATWEFDEFTLELLNDKQEMF
mmetsp:Transcript_30405/g.50504  ORF Transcript_30405/g.50504 Transcript_30405/m.50504 type:complete len:110 (-) Transcript_30405:38-367(-)